MTILIADCETSGLLDTMKHLWCIQLGDADTDEVTIYSDAAPGYPPIAEAIARLKAADNYVFHNGVGFDLDAINHFHPDTLSMEKLIDTLVLCRLAQPEERDHRLDTWGVRIGVAKGKYAGDFQQCDEELLTYARQDIVVARALFHKVKHVLTWGESAKLEHDVTRAMVLQERNGFRFDVEAAQRLDAELRGEVADLEAKLKAAFPPIERSVTIIPKINNKARGYVKGEPFVKRWVEDLNPSSRQQLAERLVSAGWRPKEIGDNGHPKLDEKTLAELKIPEAPLVLAYFRATKKLGMLSDGKGGWLKAVKPDGRIHGRVNPCGAVTGRMAHSSPNVAQADSDPRMRSLWLPREGWKLVGVDAEGLEARVLAHYLSRYDGGNYGRIILDGKSEDRTDVHSLNLKALVTAGLVSPKALEEGFKEGRSTVKNILYALLFGARDPKLGAMLKLTQRAVGQSVSKVPNKELGVLVRRALSTSIVGLDKLTAALEKRKAERGYLVGLDGRHLNVRKANAILNTLCQGGGASVMKKALALFMETEGHALGRAFALCANVHDEIQLECVPEHAEHYGAAFAECIHQAGLALGVRCPLAGKAAVGSNWSETH